MKLQSIQLKNYRLFDELSVDFHPELTVLIADNGSGKTTILEAIRATFSNYLAAFPTSKGQWIAQSDVRFDIQSITPLKMMRRFPTEIHACAQVDSQSMCWFNALNSEKSKTTRRDARELSLFAQRLKNSEEHRPDLPPRAEQNWPLLAYYGTGRLWNQKKLTASKTFKSGFFSRAAGYMDCMEPASSYKLFVDWFGYAYRTDMSEKIRFLEKNTNLTLNDPRVPQGTYAPLVQAIVQAVNIVLSPTGWRDITYSEGQGDVLAHHDDHGQLPVSYLSDGIRNTIALVADIAFRAVQLNGHLAHDATAQTQGIVLIDEVDMHLHPSWQQTILGSLRQAFPNIQFIVTTHSPQVLSTVRRENIRILGRDVLNSYIASPPLAMTYGEPSGDVLHSVMMVDPQPPIKEKADLQRLTNMVDQGEYESSESIELLYRLKVALGKQHPQLQRLERSIQRQRMLRG